MACGVELRKELVGLYLGFGCGSLVGRDEVIFTKHASALVYWIIVNIGDERRGCKRGLQVVDGKIIEGIQL